MIERNLRDVTLRKYGSVFMDTFGFYPLTFFGAIGDNFTDNYANIQVAINESLKKGLKYIFVPEGIYQYTGNLLGVEEITFIGNSQFAKIVNGDKEIPIYQIGMQPTPFEKGTATLNGSSFKITTKTKNPTEFILLNDTNGLHVIDDILDYGNIRKKLNQSVTILSAKLAISKIELLTDGVYLEFDNPVENVNVEWRVR